MADPQALAAAMKESSDKDPRGSMGDSDFLNFSGKQGKFTIGKAARTIQPDEEWIVNISGFEDGWVCWKGGQPVAQRMANISGTPVPTPDFEENGPFNSDKGEGWFQAKAMTLKNIETDEQGYFKINSISGVSAMADLQRDFVAQATAGKGCWPVVTLDAEEFTAKGFKNYKPVFNVVEWLDEAALTALMTGEASEEAVEEEPEIAPEVEKVEPPKRTRRRL